MNGLDALEPKALWRHFDAIRRLPRPSKKEGKVIEHLEAWARSHGFKAAKDAAGNLLVHVPATPGRETAEPVLLQGHVDMVCQKAPDRAIDFETEGIDAYVAEGVVRARGTTLGADNGIGVAAALAAADDPSVVHGPLELLFTVDEETGLSGAAGVDLTAARAGRLLNLDSEDLGVLFVGCAGGGQDEFVLTTDRVPPHAAPTPNAALLVHVHGLLGGHSGLEIGAHRANAIKVLARILWLLREDVAYALDTFGGGSAHNAIPKEAQATLVVGAADVARATAAIAACAADIQREFAGHEPGLRCDVTAVDEPAAVMATASRDRLLRLLVGLPHGLQEMSRDMPGLVETSLNVAVLTAAGPSARLVVSTRSSVAEALQSLRLTIRAIGELAGAAVRPLGGYPGWRPNVQSPLLATCRALWAELTGQPAEVTAVHAGLECGILGEKRPGLDMISFGPTIRGAHTIDEHVDIASVARFWDYLKALLARL